MDLRERGFNLGSLEDGGSIPEEGVWRRSAAVVVIAPNSGGARYPPSSPQPEHPSNSRTDLPGSGSERPLFINSAKTCSAEVVSGPCCARFSLLPTLHSQCPSPSKTPGPHLLTHSSPFALRVDKPISCGWRCSYFRWDLCAFKTQGAKDTEFGRGGGRPVRKWPWPGQLWAPDRLLAHFLTAPGSGG